MDYEHEPRRQPGIAVKRTVAGRARESSPLRENGALQIV